MGNISSLNRKALVTGHNGFIGKHICKALLSRGWAVTGLGETIDYDSNVDSVYRKLDIRNRLDVANFVREQNPHVIIHLAARRGETTGYFDIYECFDTNQQGSLSIIEAALEATNLEKFVFLGSCEEYGLADAPFEESKRECPSTTYGLSKLSVTHILQALYRMRNFPSVILRPSIVYGPGQRMGMFLPSLINCLLNGRSFDMSSGGQLRDFVYIDDLIEAIVLAIESANVCGEVINISSFSPVLIKDVAKEVAAQIHNSAVNLINFGAKKYRIGESMFYCANNSKSKLLLGWVPKTSLKEGIRRTVRWALDARLGDE